MSQKKDEQVKKDQRPEEKLDEVLEAELVDDPDKELEKEQTEAKASAGTEGAGEQGGEEEKNSADSQAQAQLAQQLMEERKRLLILQADFQNYKRRTEEEKEKTVKFANEKLILSLLAVMDNFERALDAAPEKDSFYEGVAMIYDQMNELLKNNGLEEIESTGKPFDHDSCDCVAMVEDDQYESGIVVDTMRKGYRLNDKVIRPAMVRVAK